MSTPGPIATLLLFALAACTGRPTPAPPDGWANNAPTQVERAIDRGTTQLLEVRQADLRTWVSVPATGAKVGDYVLLGQGTPRTDVQIPELGERADMVVDIAHVRVVDEETARRTIAGRPPAGRVPIGTIYAELDERNGQEVVVYGTVVKATPAIGSVWVHLQDGTGDAATGTNDLTVQASQLVVTGQRVAFRGVLRKDVDLGYGYHYDALVEEATVVE